MSSPARAMALAAVVLTASADAAPSPGPLEPLRFLTGCWRGPSGKDQVVEEHYTSPSANLMLGMARYTRNGVATSYEFYTISTRDSGLVFTPRLEGQAPVPFPLAKLDKTGVTWENPAHDFPTRIAYRRAGDSLMARIEGPGPDGKTASEEWRMARVRCED
jgi:uncharacterized protein DUF6265